MHIATNEVIVINFNCQVSFPGDTLSAARSRDLLQIYGQCRLADVIQVSGKLGVESCLYHRRKRFMQRAFWLGNDNKLILKKKEVLRLVLKSVLCILAYTTFYGRA